MANNGHYDIEMLIEYWSHDRFFGAGNFKQKLDCTLTAWNIARREILWISDQLLNHWLPAFIHYFKVGEPTVDYFITALAARLIWLADDDKVMGNIEPRDRLWGICVSNFKSLDEKIAVSKYSTEISAILKAIDEIAQSRVPPEISAWLFDELKSVLQETETTIKIAKNAQSKKDCPEPAQQCFAVTDSVRTHVENLLINTH